MQKLGKDIGREGPGRIPCSPRSDYSSTLKMEATDSCEALVTTVTTYQPHGVISQYSNLRIHGRSPL
jgi:hypothetical protein